MVSKLCKIRSTHPFGDIKKCRMLRFWWTLGVFFDTITDDQIILLYTNFTNVFKAPRLELQPLIFVCNLRGYSLKTLKVKAIFAILKTFLQNIKIHCTNVSDAILPSLFQFSNCCNRRSWFLLTVCLVQYVVCRCIYIWNTSFIKFIKQF